MIIPAYDMFLHLNFLKLFFLCIFVGSFDLFIIKYKYEAEVLIKNYCSRKRINAPLIMHILITPSAVVIQTVLHKLVIYITIDVVHSIAIFS